MIIQNQLKSIGRLEQALRMWEELLFLIEASFTASIASGDLKDKGNMQGGIVNWRHLRPLLLSRKPLDASMFELPPKVFKEYFLSSGMLRDLPTLLHEWNFCSRRVYAPSADLQRSLEITSLGSVHWDDVHFPFPVFGIKLPLPIVCQFGQFKDTIDFVMVKNGEPGISITCFGQEMDAHRFISPNMRERITRAMVARRFGKVEKCVEELMSQPGYFEIPPTQIFTNPTPDGMEVVKDLQQCKFLMHLVDAEGEVVPSSGEAVLDENMQLIVRLVVGLCLHLELAGLRSKKTSPRVTWQKNPDLLSRDASAITDGALICEVNSSHVLTDQEREVHARIRELGLTRAVAEMPVHFRTGYWRRRPGKGNDPTAPRCVEVHWTMVNEQRLPPNAVPAGSEVVVI